jgi:hypothetical protein
MGEAARRARAAELFHEYATTGTGTAGLAWHEKHYTVVVSGAFGLTDDQLLTVAEYLKITVD